MGMFGKILLALLVAAVALFFLKRALGGTKPTPTRAQRDQAAAPPEELHRPKSLVSCMHCGAHLPAEDAIWHSGEVYCSLAHRNAGPKS